MLTVAYITNREEPMIGWFFRTLHRECGGNYSGIKLVVVDFFAESPGRTIGFAEQSRYPFVHVAPKPCVWQGKNRLTKIDYFAASNARNTALCHAQDGWIAYVDDLSAFMPGWLDCVRQAMRDNYVVCGAYKKVEELTVDESGNVTHHKEIANGNDPRLGLGSDSHAVPSRGFYGCSVAMPVEAMLSINGWPEDCDGMGYEDCVTGAVLHNAGYPNRYDRRMMTLESAPHHFIGTAHRREDKGQSPLDKSHAMNALLLTNKSFNRGVRSSDRRPLIAIQTHHQRPEGRPNFDLRSIRQGVLTGNPFPVTNHPSIDWFDGKPLVEM